MSPKESYESVTCPACGATPRKHCVNMQTRKLLEGNLFKKYHFCHHARVKLFEKRGAPLVHDNWPVTRLKP